MQQQAAPEISACTFGDLAPGRECGWNEMALHPTATTAFLQTAARHSPAGFRPGLLQYAEGGRTLGGAAAFSYDFRLDMPLGPRLRALGDRIAGIAPRLVRVPLLCLGSPMSDRCALVLDRSLDGAGRKRALAALLDGSLAAARSQGADIVALKDLDDRTSGEARGLLEERGFACTPSLPVAVLDLPFRSEDEYLASLSPKMRSDLRRKMRQSHGVDVTLHDSAAGLEAEIDRLYAQTRARSKADYGEFDALPPRFLPDLLAAMAPAARLAITHVDGAVAGFNIFLTHGRRAVAFKIGLSSRLAREHNLYFVNWMFMVRHCIDRGIPELEMGQTTYELKSRLGCRLEPSWIWFRHRNAAWNSILGMIGSRVSFARMDPELRAAGYGA